MSQSWLWTAQNAFLTETSPDGVRWADRHGKAFGRGFVRNGNVEKYLTYKKLHRTGRLLRSLKKFARGNVIGLTSSVPYAKEQNEGGGSGGTRVKGKYVQGGVSAVLLGGRIHARPFMTPSKRVLDLPYSLLVARIKKLGW